MIYLSHVQLPALNSQQWQYWYVRHLTPSDTEEFKDKQLRILPGMNQACLHEGLMQEAAERFMSRFALKHDDSTTRLFALYFILVF